MLTCKRCGNRIFGDRLQVGIDSAICMACAEELEKKPVKCPVCGNENPPEEDMALLLTRATATPQEKMDANASIVHICPKCHVLFFDDFQYEILILHSQSQEKPS